MSQPPAAQPQNASSKASEDLRAVFADASAQARSSPTHPTAHPFAPAKGTPTRKLVAENQTQPPQVMAKVQELRERAEDFMFPNDLVRYLEGDRGGPEIGMFTKAFVAERYGEKHGLSMGYAARPSEQEGKWELTPAMVSKLTDTLTTGTQFGLMISDTDGVHTSPALLHKRGDTLSVLTIDTNGSTNRVWSSVADGMIEPVANALRAEVLLKKSPALERQADLVSCHTDAPVTLKDLMLYDPEFASNYQQGEPLPAAALRSAQISSFLYQNDFDPSDGYRKTKDRPTGAHRDVHSVGEPGTKSQNHFLIAKSLQFAEAALAWLESFEDPDEASQAAEDLMTKHFYS